MKKLIVNTLKGNRTQRRSWQVRKVQEAIHEADNVDFATDEQVNAVFKKYEVSFSDSNETKLDQILFNLNSDQFKQITRILNAPVTTHQGLSRLMAVQAPWEVLTPTPL